MRLQGGGGERSLDGIHQHQHKQQRHRQDDSSDDCHAHASAGAGAGGAAEVHVLASSAHHGLGSSSDGGAAGCSAGSRRGGAAAGVLSRPRALACLGVVAVLGTVALLAPTSTSDVLLLPGSGAAVHVPLLQQLHPHAVARRMPQMQAAPTAAGGGAPAADDTGSGGRGSGGGHDPDPPDPPPRDWMFLVGTGLGWASSVLYLASRASQILKNHKRRSAEGLAMSMFMCAVCANMCTGSGIMLRTFNLEQLKQQAPWILGSLGTITLDFVILTQSFKYAAKLGGQQQQQQQQGAGARALTPQQSSRRRQHRQRHAGEHREHDVGRSAAPSPQHDEEAGELSPLLGSGARVAGAAHMQAP